jgi:chromosome segregation ATPase
LIRQLDDMEDQVCEQERLLTQSNGNNTHRILSYEQLIDELNEKITSLSDYKAKYNELVKKMEAKEEKHVRDLSDLVNTFKDLKSCQDVKAKLDNVNLQKAIKIKTDELYHLKNQPKKVESATLKTKLDNVNHQKLVAIKQMELENLRQITDSQELVQLQSENEQLVGDVHEPHTRLSNCVSELTSLRKNNHRQSEDLDILINQHDELLTNYDTVLKDLEEYKNSNKNGDNLQKEITALKTLVDELCAESEGYHTENFDLKNKVVSLQADFQRQKETIRDLDDENDELQNHTDKLDQHIINLTRSLENKNKEVENVLEQLKDSKNNEVNMNNYVHYGEFAALEDDYKTAYNQQKQAENKLEQSEQRVNDLELEVKGLNEQINQYNVAINQWDDRCQYLETELTTQCESLEADNEQLTVVNEQWKERCDKLVEDNTSLTHNIMTMENNYSQLEAKYEDVVADDEALLKQVGELHEKKELLWADLENSQIDNKRLQKDLECVKKQYELCQKDLVNSSNSYDARTKQYNLVTKQLTDVKNMNTYHQKCMKADYEQLHAKYESLDNKYHQLVVENGEMAEQINVMKPIYDKINKSTEGWDIVNLEDTKETKETKNNVVENETTL